MKLTLLSTTASLLSRASARIVGFAAPKVVAPDTDVEVVIITENYIQAIQDVATSFGIDNGDFYLGSLGNLLNTKFLGPEFSNIDTNITHTVRIPADQAKGEATVIQAAHFSLTGKSVTPLEEIWYVNVTVGDATSTEYSRSAAIPVPAPVPS